MKYFKDYSDGSITYVEDDGFISKKYWLIPHPDSEIRYNSNLTGMGKILNRIDGPADISFFRCGKISETWWIKGVIHRELYPAIVEKRENPYELIEYRYFNRGKEITSQVKEYLEENNIQDPFNILYNHSVAMKLKFW